MRILGQIHCDKNTRSPQLTSTYDDNGVERLTQMTVYGTKEKLPATATSFPAVVTVEELTPFVEVKGARLKFIDTTVAQMDREIFEQVIQECGVRETLSGLLDHVRSAAAASLASGDSPSDPSTTDQPSPADPIEDTEPSVDSSPTPSEIITPAD